MHGCRAPGDFKNDQVGLGQCTWELVGEKQHNNTEEEKGTQNKREIYEDVLTRGAL